MKKPILLDPTRSKHGVILLTVIVLIIVLSIVVVSIMSLNLNQVQIASQVTQKVTAQQLAQGALFKYHQAVLAGDSLGFFPYTETIGNRNYVVNAVLNEAGTGPYGSNRINITVTY